MSVVYVISSCLVLASALAAGEAPLDTSPVRIAAAANFKEPLEKLNAAFEANTGHKLEIVTGSTGKLFAQIVHGAPYDVFLAADDTRPAKLEESGYAVRGSRFTYALGRLALYQSKPRGNAKDRLERGDFTRLAVCNAELAPYGAAARQYLERVGLFEAVRAKLVYGENVAQTYQFVRSGNAELGFVAYSQVFREDAGRYWLVPETSHEPIRQDAVLLKPGAERAAARRFIDYLRSEDAKAVIAACGYLLPANSRGD